LSLRLSNSIEYGDSMRQAFVVFDRDGTLIDHVHHLVDPELVRIKEDLVKALQLLQNYDFKFGVISNQSVIGRGLATNLDVESVNSKIIEFIKPLGIVVDFVYFCPHLPDAGCSCRKPEIGLGLKAVEEHQLDPSVSFMVGDQESDMIFGRNLGCKTVQLKGGADKSTFTDYYSDTLEGAARWIIAEIDRKGS
jgi:D-glycero-D-manno-heptose 1,7-bisphosphate phosphatase